MKTRPSFETSGISNTLLLGVKSPKNRNLNINDLETKSNKSKLYAGGNKELVKYGKQIIFGPEHLPFCVELTTLILK
jgi:hypothetical protein